ncbi:pyrimidine dimer DNA glycosylase/endonuclease V [Billgrantia sp. LNSP4103-1]|uniref:pyrimidine dimer DNA glycosylase/endonuclease V n=1 Tax=Billgrantia sp. LNSP4103-1 TaxID=3410266 RepID=UPI00403FBD03
MRLWSLHPKYLDPQGLVALWREALLAQAVLRGDTRGYRNHPQLHRFRDHATPLAAISLFLKDIHLEAMARGYAFDVSKIRPATASVSLVVTAGQMEYEWKHLLAKLKVRNPALYRKWQVIERPEAHPIFSVCPGEVESWERQ